MYSYKGRDHSDLKQFIIHNELSADISPFTYIQRHTLQRTRVSHFRKIQYVKGASKL